MTDEEKELVPFASAREAYAWMRKRLKQDPNKNVVVSDADLLQEVKVEERRLSKHFLINLNELH